MYFQVTLWDYDQYATNEFLGEVLIELNRAGLNNEPTWYTLVDMDEESPIRAVCLFVFYSTHSSTLFLQRLRQMRSYYAGSSQQPRGIYSGYDPLSQPPAGYAHGDLVSFVDFPHNKLVDYYQSGYRSDGGEPYYNHYSAAVSGEAPGREVS